MSILSVYATNRSLVQLTDQDLGVLDIVNVSFGVLVDGAISVEQLTHLEEVKRFRESNPKLRIYLSLASGETSKFGDVTRTEEGIQKVVESVVKIVSEWDLDGIDVDWEYPEGPIERHNHTLLLEALRKGLDTVSDTRYRALSIAAGSKNWYFEITELSESVKYLDYVNLMTYDINAGYEVTMHHSCPTKMASDQVEDGSTEENIALFIKNGVPAEKLIIGAAFYSRQWHGVVNENNGLHSYAGSKSDYGPGYTRLIEEYVNQKGYIRYWDEAANAPYLFNGDNFITYEDEESLTCKCDLVKKWQIAGIMAWEYSYDEHHTLISVMRHALDRNR
ncbi:MAG: glycoside hydrolase family 18 protein [Cellulosilyticaceae bacterium]